MGPKKDFSINQWKKRNKTDIDGDDMFPKCLKCIHLAKCKECQFCGNMNERSQFTGKGIYRKCMACAEFHYKIGLNVSFTVQNGFELCWNAQGQHAPIYVTYSVENENGFPGLLHVPIPVGSCNCMYLQMYYKKDKTKDDKTKDVLYQPRLTNFTFEDFITEGYTIAQKGYLKGFVPYKIEEQNEHGGHGFQPTDTTQQYT